LIIHLGERMVTDTGICSHYEYFRLGIPCLDEI